MALPPERPANGTEWIRQGTAIVRNWPWRLLITLGAIAALVPLALWGYQASARLVTVVVDGVPLTWPTHQRLVGGVLAEAGLALGPADHLSLPLEASWSPHQAIVVQRVYPITVRLGDQEVLFYSRPRSLLEILARVGITLYPNDKVYVNATLVPESAYADESVLRAILTSQAGLRHLAAPRPPVRLIHVEVVRALPWYVNEDGVEVELRTTATTVGAALEEAGLRLYRADRIYPPLDTPLRPGLRVRLSRSMPIFITADGRTYGTRTWASTVAELLREEGLALNPQDRVEPPLTTRLKAGMEVRIIRVTTLDRSVESPIPYVARQEPDPTMELDQVRLQPGQEGLKATVTRTTYEDGREVGQTFLGERIVREPVDQVLYYGTQIVIRTLETPYGPVEYWRKFRVLATSYYPSTCDKSPDDPTYGITYTGKRATRGIIAVDPRVIPLHTRMYVPGYGLGAAEDIGGKIKGRHIDVCFDDADWGKGLWDTHYVDVYLLTPVPPSSKIAWVLP